MKKLSLFVFLLISSFSIFFMTSAMVTQNTISPYTLYLTKLKEDKLILSDGSVWKNTGGIKIKASEVHMRLDQRATSDKIIAQIFWHHSDSNNNIAYIELEKPPIKDLSIFHIEPSNISTKIILNDGSKWLFTGDPSELKEWKAEIPIMISRDISAPVYSESHRMILMDPSGWKEIKVILKFSNDWRSTDN